MLFIDRLGKITQGSVTKGAGAVSVIGIGGDEDCGNLVPRLDQVSMEFEVRSSQACVRQRSSMLFRRDEATQETPLAMKMRQPYSPVTS